MYWSHEDNLRYLPQFVVKDKKGLERHMIRKGYTKSDYGDFWESPDGGTVRIRQSITGNLVAYNDPPKSDRMPNPELRKRDSQDFWEEYWREKKNKNYIPLPKGLS